MGVEIWVPIGISLLSLVVGGVALGWNIYRDVVLKARVNVRVAVVNIVDRGGHFGDSKISITVTNHGPGPVRIQMIHGKIAPLWRRLLRRSRYFVVMQDTTDPLSGRLPAKLDVGDSIDLFLPYEERAFLSGEVTHIGVTDSFGRVHYAPRTALKAAKEQFSKDFPDASSTSGA